MSYDNLVQGQSSLLLGKGPRQGGIARLLRGVVGVAFLATCTCNCDERLIAEEPDYRIEPLCEVHCSRVMECAFQHFGDVDFTDEAGCFQVCVEDRVWERTCADENQALLECMQQLECPDFALHYTTPRPQRPCGAEQTAYSACLPGDVRQ